MIVADKLRSDFRKSWHSDIISPFDTKRYKETCDGISCYILRYVLNEADIEQVNDNSKLYEIRGELSSCNQISTKTLIYNIYSSWVNVGKN